MAQRNHRYRSVVDTRRNRTVAVSFSFLAACSLLEPAATQTPSGPRSGGGGAISVAGEYLRFGTGCRGKETAQGFVLPARYESEFGKGAEWFATGTAGQRYQQVFRGTEIPGPRVFLGLSFRHDDVLGGPGGVLSLRIRLGATTATPKTIGATRSYEKNFDQGLSATVFQGKLSLSESIGHVRDLAGFTPVLPFTRPLPFVPGTWKNFLVEIQNLGSQDLRHHFDAVFETGTWTTACVFGSAKKALPQAVLRGRGLVLRFSSPGTKRLRPVLSALGRPILRRSMLVELSFAAENAPALLLTGASRTRIASLALPLDLGPLGADGCKLYTSIDHVRTCLTDRMGACRVTVRFPDAPSLIGVRYYQQFATMDRGLPLGFAFSNAAAARIGDF